MRLLTAHAAKGLEWDLVVVAGVQEGVWPDLRLRGSLLGSRSWSTCAAGPPDDAAVAPVSAPLLDEERRLFYVAVTRARRQLSSPRWPATTTQPVPVPRRARPAAGRRRRGR